MTEKENIGQLTDRLITLDGKLATTLEKYAIGEDCVFLKDCDKAYDDVKEIIKLIRKEAKRLKSC